ncbi:hypothetical protein DFJ74DRAFT_694216 [Hyaloraphidium curvatum]|nr:hypothetical protein DFJ74DRAFT_694216 [Hyaloraphidium curvatum]
MSLRVPVLPVALAGAALAALALYAYPPRHLRALIARFVPADSPPQTGTLFSAAATLVRLPPNGPPGPAEPATAELERTDAGVTWISAFSPSGDLLLAQPAEPAIKACFEGRRAEWKERMDAEGEWRVAVEFAGRWDASRFRRTLEAGIKEAEDRENNAVGVSQAAIAGAGQAPARGRASQGRKGNGSDDEADDDHRRVREQIEAHSGGAGGPRFSRLYQEE